MKILLASDGSAHSALAETLLLKFPSLRVAEVTVVRVVPSQMMVFGNLQPMTEVILTSTAEDLWEQSNKVARSENAAVVERLKSQGLNSTGLVLEGDPAHEILEHMTNDPHDLVIIGSRGQGAFKSFLLGSVVRKVLSHAPCSVLVARHYNDMTPEASKTELQSREKLRVLVGFDGSNGSQACLDWLNQYGHDIFDSACAVCAEPLISMPAGLDPMDIPDYYRFDKDRSLSVAQKGAEALKDLAPNVTAHADLGPAPTVLMETALDDKTDLIVMGAKRHGAIERFLLGSVSYEVATSAPCSVLVVRY